MVAVTVSVYLLPRSRYTTSHGFAVATPPPRRTGGRADGPERETESLTPQMTGCSQYNVNTSST